MSTVLKAGKLEVGASNVVLEEAVVADLKAGMERKPKGEGVTGTACCTVIFLGEVHAGGLGTVVALGGEVAAEATAASGEAAARVAAEAGHIMASKGVVAQKAGLMCTCAAAGPSVAAAALVVCRKVSPSTAASAQNSGLLEVRRSTRAELGRSASSGMVAEASVVSVSNKGFSETLLLLDSRLQLTSPSWTTISLAGLHPEWNTGLLHTRSCEREACGSSEGTVLTCLDP